MNQGPIKQVIFKCAGCGGSIEYIEDVDTPPMEVQVRDHHDRVSRKYKAARMYCSRCYLFYDIVLVNSAARSMPHR